MTKDPYAAWQGSCVVHGGQFQVQRIHRVVNNDRLNRNGNKIRATSRLAGG